VRVGANGSAKIVNLSPCFARREIVRLFVRVLLFMNAAVFEIFDPVSWRRLVAVSRACQPIHPNAKGRARRRRVFAIKPFRLTWHVPVDFP
jgi:hypothetical protein